MVEIQSLILGMGVEQITGSFFNVFGAPIVEVFPTVNIEEASLLFPCSYIAVLRREDDSSDVEVSLNFIMCNKDNEILYVSHNESITKIPEGYRFCVVHGTSNFILPHLGDYVLYLEAVSIGMSYSYRYDFICMTKENITERKHNATTKD